MAEPIGLGPRPAGMLRSLLSAAVLASLFILAAPTAMVMACSCAEMNGEQALGNADVAFVGVVAAIDDPSAGPLVNSGEPLRYTFAVEQTIKGELASRIGLFSARSGASCGQEFGLAQRWRVYAYVDESRQLQSHLCSGNELLAEGVPIPAPSPSGLTLPPLGVLIAFGVGFVVAGFSVWAFTRRPGSSVS
jgi:hypothetical protein